MTTPHPTDRDWKNKKAFFVKAVMQSFHKHFRENVISCPDCAGCAYTVCEKFLRDMYAQAIEGGYEYGHTQNVQKEKEDLLSSLHKEIEGEKFSGHQAQGVAIECYNKGLQTAQDIITKQLNK